MNSSTFKHLPLGLTCLGFFLLVGACNNEKKETPTVVTQTPPAIISCKNVTWEETDSAAGTKIALEFPTSSSALNTNIHEWMNETLGGTFQGDVNQGDTLAEYYGLERKKEVDEWKKELGESASVNASSYYVQLLKLYETAELVTYSSQVYIYNGGAHGGSTFIGQTFRKTDGRRFGWDMFTQKARDGKQLRRYIMDELKRHYKTKTDKELYDYLMIEDYQKSEDAFPLPKSAPYFVTNGLQFVYQEYEIASYAAGSAIVTIPWSKLDGMLTVSAEHLLK